MNILVTGGAGFIGSHTVDALIADGHQVVVVDDLSSGKRQNLNSKVKLIEASITDAPVIDQIFTDNGPFEAIVHFAAQKSVTHSVDDPVEDANRNIIGSLVMLEAAKKHGTKQFIFSSTGGALYGEKAILPTPEDSPLHPVSPYGISKRSVEEYLSFYRRQGITTQILRYSNVYGPRQDPYGEAGVIAIFCQNLVQGEPMKVFGKGEQTRDFVYVADVASANLKALAAPKSGVWNIGTGQENSINAVLDELRSIGQEFDLTMKDIKYLPPRLGELDRSCLDAKLAEAELNWTSKVSLKEGLRETLRSFIK